MGFLDFLKTNKSEEEERARYVPHEAGRTAGGGFRGDLAYPGRMPPPASNEAYWEPAADAEDAVVLLSYIEVVPNGWICPECGAQNDYKSASCMVCGCSK